MKFFARLLPLVLVALAQSLACAQPPALLVLDFEMIDELHDPRTEEADRGRLARSAPLLRELLAFCPRYRLVDAEPARDALERARAARREVVLARWHVVIR